MRTIIQLFPRRCRLTPSAPPLAPLLDRALQDAYAGFVETLGVQWDTKDYARRRRSCYNKENVDDTRGLARPGLPAWDDAAGALGAGLVLAGGVEGAPGAGPCAPGQAAVAAVSQRGTSAARSSR